MPKSPALKSKATQNKMTNLAKLQSIVDNIDELINSLPPTAREVYQKAYDEANREDTGETG